jgi:hypothetical protein
MEFIGSAVALAPRAPHVAQYLSINNNIVLHPSICITLHHHNLAAAAAVAIHSFYLWLTQRQSVYESPIGEESPSGPI